MSEIKAPGQKWARFGLGFGAALSVVGNVAHTYLVESAVSLWLRVPFAMAWPIVLFIGIEVLVRVEWRRRFLDHAGRVLIWGPAGVVAAVVSYLHLHSLMSFAGESWFAALVGPLAIDGLMIGCTVALLAIRAATLMPAPAEVDVDAVVERWTQNTVPAETLADVQIEPGAKVTAEMVRQIEESTAPSEPPVRTRATPEKQRAMVEMILQGAINTDTDIATDTGVSPATIRLYRAVYRTLRDNPMADIGPKFQGRSVNAELVNVIRDAANRERAL